MAGAMAGYAAVARGHADGFDFGMAGFGAVDCAVFRFDDADINFGECGAFRRGVSPLGAGSGLGCDVAAAGNFGESERGECLARSFGVRYCGNGSGGSRREFRGAAWAPCR